MEDEAMNDEIRVHDVKYKTRQNLLMRYRDPVTHKQVARTTGSTRKRDAERIAAKWEAELREGRYQKPSRITWEEFRERYEHEKLATLSERTLESSDAAFNHLESEIDPKLLESLTSQQLSRFQRKLSDKGMKATTLASHLRAIRAALNWAVRQGLMRKSPTIDMPKGAKGIDRSMRGRPITLEEVERMLDVVTKVRKLEPEKWKLLLKGLWLSGLRLGEALALSWDPDADVAVQLGGKFPRIRLFAEGHKAHRDQWLTITPDFAKQLLAIPEDERHGLVFGIHGKVRNRPLSTKRASRYISAIGEKALVVVDANDLRVRIDPKTEEETSVPRCATAHDLRRAFGTRWSKRVMPATLMQLMRHKSIETTMKYYVEHSADDLAADLWAMEEKDLGNTLGNIRGFAPEKQGEPQPNEARKPLPAKG